MTSARSERRGAGPSSRSRESRQPKRSPPSITSCVSQTSAIWLRGNSGCDVNSVIRPSEIADSDTPLNTWNSVTVLA
jgi:hypothetical protein